MRTITALFLFIAMSASSPAAEPYLCRNGYFPSAAGQIRLATVITPTAQPLPFTQDWTRCPGPGCGTVHRGDRVLVSESHDGKSCAWHPRRFSDDLGWLPSGSLTMSATRSPRTQDWTGSWTPVDGGPTIRIRRAPDGKSLRVDGNARWYGDRLALRGGERVVHFGSFSGEGAPHDALLTIVDASTCEVRMQWIAGYLVAADNGRCGGLNVRFDGVYRRGRR